MGVLNAIDSNAVLSACLWGYEGLGLGLAALKPTS